MKYPSSQKTAAFREELRVGKEIKKALDKLIPENCRMSEPQIAKILGVSQQYVNRVELRALYKLRARLRPLLGGVEYSETDSMARPARATTLYGSVAEDLSGD